MMNAEIFDVHDSSLEIMKVFVIVYKVGFI